MKSWTLICRLASSFSFFKIDRKELRHPIGPGRNWGVLIVQISLGLATFGISLLVEYAILVRCVSCWCLWSISNRNKMFFTRTNCFWICFVSVMELQFFFYTSMALMVAILPTHPRVSEVTCMRADAKRQQDLTGTHTQTVSEKILFRR
jgi:hypothetical protein